MFQEFREAFKGQYCFGIEQIRLLFPDFRSENLVRWGRMGYIIKLRNGLYTLSEYQDEAGIAFHFAGKMYQPSYISLHSALNYYGIIPEFPGTITSVCTKKTKCFENEFGRFSYQTVQPGRFFGYKLINTSQWVVKIAEPEKAIVDLLYMYPMYNNKEELEMLRFDEDNLSKTISAKKLSTFAGRMKNKALQDRVDHLINVYGL